MEIFNYHLKQDDQIQSRNGLLQKGEHKAYLTYKETGKTR